MRIIGRAAPWLWRVANWALVLSAIGVGAAAWALSLGAADPPRAGPLLWQDDFTSGLGRWAVAGDASGRMEASGGALVVTFIEGGERAVWAVTSGPTGDYTLEVAGASADGEAAYGLIFGWQDEAHYNAVLINGNGYAEAYTQAGAARTSWLAWQQWPHILAGGESNRVRVDVHREATGTAVTARVNDEILATTTLAGEAGQVGLMARGAGPARTVFSWARLWATNGPPN